jgi:adenosylhomocysteine nucleosidase
LIVSGDRFVSSAAEAQRLQQELPEALAVDMESAAMAQVCADFGRPLAVLRTVSDRADAQAHVDFPRFLDEVAAPYGRDIVLAALAG